MSAATNHPDLIDALPQGPGFRFVSEILSLSETEIETARDWRIDEPLIVDHFSDGPRIVPGVLMLEQAAQSALLLALHNGVARRGTPLYLAHARTDFLRPALAPCRLCVHVTVIDNASRQFGFVARCTVDQAPVARIRGIAKRAPVPT